MLATARASLVQRLAVAPTAVTTAVRAAAARSLATITAAPTAPAGATPAIPAAAATTTPARASKRASRRNKRYEMPAQREPGRNYNVGAAEPVAEIQLNGYILAQVNFFGHFVQRAAQALDLCIEGPTPLPHHVRRWTVLTSPFKYKKFQEAFERRTFKRLIKIYAASPDAVDKFLLYLTEVAPAGIGMRVVRYEREEPGFGDRMQKEAEAILADGGKVLLPMHIYNTQNPDFYAALKERLEAQIAAEAKYAEAKKPKIEAASEEAAPTESTASADAVDGAAAPAETAVPETPVSEPAAVKAEQPSA
ncbi:mitochondrial 37S ribosomal protein rsm10 [Allomyces javanicus]|nr:mitochondrial 37S ribosomal protein rsm10 [Allomyces javanicus]